MIFGNCFMAVQNEAISVYEERIPKWATDSELTVYILKNILRIGSPELLIRKN